MHVFAWLLRYAERAARLPADSDPSLHLCRTASDVTDSRSDPSAPTAIAGGGGEPTGDANSQLVMRESASDSATAASRQNPQQASQDDALVLDPANALSLLISSDFRMCHVLTQKFGLFY